jgi:4-amino-4-deoxy-L-arabinose transferase-like glycosyltransferase
VSGATSETPAVAAAPAPRAGHEQRAAGRLRAPGREGALRLGGLAVVIAAAAVLNTVRLSQNGYANIFYSAGVRSMLRSWHNFFFVASDPAGLVTIDKPPLGLWLQAASAKVFGFSSLSLLLPEALMGVAIAAVLYVVVARRFGTLAGLVAGLVCAFFPSLVAVSRSNNVDAPLILLMLLACVAAIRACESGRWRTLLLSGALIGLAFNTKTLAAYLAVPGIALAYLLCAPVPLRRRIVQLLAAGVLAGVVSFAWIAVVEATPASQRPYIGSSTDNSELGLTFSYNGFGRVEGQAGGPGSTHGKPGARVPIEQLRRVDEQRAREHKPLPPPPQPPAGPSPNTGRYPKPIPFGGPPGPLRLFGVGLGDQGGWLLPLAFFGLIAALVLLWLERRDSGGEEAPAAAGAGGSPGDGPGAPAADDAQAPAAAPDDGRAPGPPRSWRRDPRLAAVIVLGGWFAVEAAVLSLSKGIVHPYYISALAPGTGAMAGIGVYSLIALCRRRAGGGPIIGIALTALAVMGTVAAELVLMHRYGYLRWFMPVLALAAAACLVALFASALMSRSRPAAIAIGAAIAVLLVAPAGYASTTWLAPVQSTFPAAGPKQYAGWGGVGLNPRGAAIDRALLRWVESHGATHRFTILTVSAPTAASFVLMGADVSGLAGYSGVDPVLDGAGLARLVERHEARYVVLGGEYSTRGGNGATKAVLAACREMAPFEWRSPDNYPNGLTLFDCAGHERQLAAQG